MAKKLKLRIVSDGTAIGTKLLDGTGNEVHGVQSIAWKVDASTQSCRAVVTLVNVPAYLHTECEVEKSEVTT